MKPFKTIINILFVIGILNAQNPEVSSEDFSTRQVHLDFHTSEHLENIGKQFDKASWQKTLKDAPTTQNPLRRFPNARSKILSKRA